MSAAAYPLAWPQGFPRSKVREKSRFEASLTKALANVDKSLTLFGADSRIKVTNIIISSNCCLGNMNPDDPGVAVWFTWNNEQVCIPVDRYRRVEENVQAIHHIIEARRTELRHGTLQLVKATFAGLRALPAPEGKHWRDILKLPKGPLPPTEQQIEEAYKKRVKAAHPDTGGSHEKMTELNQARAFARREAGL